MAELNITSLNFENEVLNADKPVLLDFYADWCGPCKMLAPVVHEIAEENAGTLKVGKINVDEQMELAMRFQVSSIPMLVVFKDGKAVAKSVGYRPRRRSPPWWKAQNKDRDRGNAKVNMKGDAICKDGVPETVDKVVNSPRRKGRAAVSGSAALRMLHTPCG